ncbi:MAG: peptidylprolyl isomerase, partial [Thermoplasmata archaeon]
EAVLGMSLGESKTVEIPADKAYGERVDDLVVQIDRKEMPPDLDCEVGQKLRVDGSDGPAAVVTVLEVTEAAVTVDGNHPLAGEDLTFDIQLVEIAA